MVIDFSPSQLDELDRDFLRRFSGQVFDTLVDQRADWMDGRTFEAEQTEIVELIKNALELDIQTEPDVVRFVGLAYAPEHYRSDALTASVLTRTLNRLEWDAKKRLDFVYGQIIDNPKIVEAAVH